jgi:hypothetical protein
VKEKIKKYWFKNVSIAVFVLFSLAMVTVIALAYLRPSGSTGIDVAKMYELRKEIVQDSKLHEIKEQE